MNEKLLMLSVPLFFSAVLLANVLVSIKQKRFMKSELENHNREVIHKREVLFSDIPSSIGEECYKSHDFFKMHNTGKEPCECMGQIEYTRYSQKEDYWMKRKN